MNVRPQGLPELSGYIFTCDTKGQESRHIVTEKAMAEWAEARGRNPFYELSIPDTALKLVQACGRLIRHEEDWGRITVLDRRIVTKRYGRDLISSLPPYRLELSP